MMEKVPPHYCGRTGAGPSTSFRGAVCVKIMNAKFRSVWRAAVIIVLLGAIAIGCVSGATEINFKVSTKKKRTDRHAFPRGGSETVVEIMEINVLSSAEGTKRELASTLGGGSASCSMQAARQRKKSNLLSRA